MKKKILLVLVLLLVVVAGFFIGVGFSNFQRGAKEKQTTSSLDTLIEDVTPKAGFTLPISWGNLPQELIDLGVIDKSKFTNASSMKGDVVINTTNSRDVVNLLWAIGLAQKSIVYDEGPMGTDYKKDVGNFASTGGWTLAKGDAVNYLNKFDLITLNPDQQKRVAEIAKNVYRPCCDNPTWFPDCNHGMAALAAIEMMVAKNLPDDEIYRNILKLNSFWFPDTYLMIAYYFDGQGTPWDKVDAKEVLGKDFSSASGASRLQSIVGPLPGQKGGGSCGA